MNRDFLNPRGHAEAVIKVGKDDAFLINDNGLAGFNGKGGIAVPDGQNNSVRLCHTGGHLCSVSTDGTSVVMVANQTYQSEVQVPINGLCTGIAIFNGGTAGGAVKVAITDSLGNVLAQSGATNQTGTNAFQKVPFTAPVLLRTGTYYVCVLCANTSGALINHTRGNFGAVSLSGQTYANGFPSKITVPTTFEAAGTNAGGPMASLY